MRFYLSISINLSKKSNWLEAYNHGRMPEIYATDEPLRGWSCGREVYNNVAHYSGVFATLDEALATVAAVYPEPRTRRVRYVARELFGDEYQNNEPLGGARLWQVEPRWSHPTRPHGNTAAASKIPA